MVKMKERKGTKLKMKTVMEKKEEKWKGKREKVWNKQDKTK